MKPIKIKSIMAIRLILAVWKLKHWSMQHPVKSHVMSSVFGASMAALIASLWVGNGKLLQISLTCIVVLLSIFVVELLSDAKRISIALAFTLLSTQVQAADQPPPLTQIISEYGGLTNAPPEETGVVMGVAVVIVGGVAVYVIIRACQVAYPKKTNQPPELNMAMAGDSMAASQIAGSDYCWADIDLSTPVVDMNCLIAGNDIGPELTIVRTTSCTMAEFKAQMAALGLNLTLGNHYARNGQPANQWDVPIIFDSETGRMPSVTIYPGQPSVRCVAERTRDFSTWEPLITNSIPIGMKMVISDNAGSDCGFYRVRIQP